MMSAPQKAVRTRKARKEFVHKYGDFTAVICEDLSKNISTEEISYELMVPRDSVAAVKANFTRGTYYPYAGPEGGSCNW